MCCPKYRAHSKLFSANASPLHAFYEDSNIEYRLPLSPSVRGRKGEDECRRIREYLILKEDKKTS